MKTETTVLVVAAGGLAIGAALLFMRKPAKATTGGTTGGGETPKGGEQSGTASPGEVPDPVDHSIAAQTQMRLKLCRNPNAMTYNDQALLLELIVRPIWNKIIDPSTPGNYARMTAPAQVAMIAAMRCPPPARLAAAAVIGNVINSAMQGGLL